MSAFSNALNLSISGLTVQSKRLRVISENVANVDTPGFARKVLTVEHSNPFNRSSGVKTKGIRLSNAERERIFDPGHPLADATGHYTGSNVDIVVELADAREAQRSYEANLKMFDQTRQMSKGLIELLRK